MEPPTCAPSAARAAPACQAGVVSEEEACKYSVAAAPHAAAPGQPWCLKHRKERLEHLRARPGNRFEPSLIMPGPALLEVLPNRLAVHRLSFPDLAALLVDLAIYDLVPRPGDGIHRSDRDLAGARASIELGA